MRANRWLMWFLIVFLLSGFGCVGTGLGAATVSPTMVVAATPGVYPTTTPVPGVTYLSAAPTEYVLEAACLEGNGGSIVLVGYLPDYYLKLTCGAQVFFVKVTTRSAWLIDPFKDPYEFSTLQTVWIARDSNNYGTVCVTVQLNMVNVKDKCY